MYTKCIQAAEAQDGIRRNNDDNFSRCTHKSLQCKYLLSVFIYKKKTPHRTFARSHHHHSVPQSEEWVSHSLHIHSTHSECVYFLVLLIEAKLNKERKKNEILKKERLQWMYATHILCFLLMLSEKFFLFHQHFSHSLTHSSLMISFSVVKPK